LKLAAFPKCFMDDLCVKHTMTVFDWIEQAATIPGLDGLEMYDGFFESFDREYLCRVRDALQRHNLAMPMMCFSPDFTHPDPVKRSQELWKQRRMIETTAFFGGRTCRVLSGQRRPEVSQELGVTWVVACIKSLLSLAEECGVILAIENHYKDNYWEYPEFAQKKDVFLEIVSRIDSPWFGVNYDPSNALLAGDDPIELLEAVKHRVVSMHASDRYLKSGALDDLRQSDGTLGYSPNLCHGVIGQGLIPYDRVFAILREVRFDGWVSIEDGMNGLGEIAESARFLRRHMENT
jgi:sugar phosphate isomerase/epimerase